jgi:hypothetical protein
MRTRLFDLAIIVKMPPPQEESILRERWLPRYDEFASRTDQAADRLADQLRAQTNLEVRRGPVAGGGYAWPEWPEAVPHPMGLPPIDVGQAIYLRDALLSLAALATIAKITYDLVKELRKAPPDPQAQEAPRIVLEIHIRNGDVIDTSTATAAEAEQTLAAATRDWEGDLQDEEQQRIRERLATRSDHDFMGLRKEAEDKLDSLLWDIWYREDLPLEARVQALRRLLQSFRDIQMAIDNAERTGSGSP